jgi:hypothetical protein
MSDENLKEKIQQACGEAYGTGRSDASDIVPILAEVETRWKTVSEVED